MGRKSAGSDPSVFPDSRVTPECLVLQYFQTHGSYQHLPLTPKVSVSNHSGMTPWNWKYWRYGKWAGNTPDKRHTNRNQSQKVMFATPNNIPDFSKDQNFKCSSKTHFLSHTIEHPSCTICLYGPCGPFWFSVLFWLWSVNFHHFVILLFQVDAKTNLFCGGKFCHKENISILWR